MATKKPLPGLNQGFWLNELLHALRNSGEVPDTDGIFPDRQGVSHMSPRRRGLSASLTGGGSVQNHLQSDFVVQLPPVGA